MPGRSPACSHAAGKQQSRDGNQDILPRVQAFTTTQRCFLRSRLEPWGRCAHKLFQSSPLPCQLERKDLPELHRTLVVTVSGLNASTADLQFRF